MSGDVQPRKRKDKKKKKDELGVEEPRGTSAALGEGDVFMHSHHEHGTGGHWCAKIIFFSLLAVLIALIGLIILENRGLTELEANSVESRYSGVLEGWLEDAPDDDHHDEHTLELKHHDVNHDELSQEIDDDDHDDEELDDQQVDIHNDDEDDGDQDDDDENDRDQDDDDDENDGDQDDDGENNGDQDDNDEQDSQEDDDEQDDASQEDEPDTDDQNSDENDVEHVNTNYGDNDEGDDDDDERNEELDEDEQTNYDREDSIENFNEQDEDNEQEYEKYRENEEGNGLNEDADDSNEVPQQDDSLEDATKARSLENDDDFNDEDFNGNKQDDNDEDEEEHEEEEEDSGIEVEKLEKEVTDDIEQLSIEDVTEQDDKDDDVSAPDDDDLTEDEEFLEADDVDDDLLVVERIVAPKGKPFIEVEDEPTTIKPADTLADEEEYEKQQEALRREQEQASHVWLKMAVGGALLVATHAVVRRLTAPRDDQESEEHEIREETPSTIDRRMTLIPSQQNVIASPREIEQRIKPIEEKILEKVSSAVKSVSIKENDEISEDDEPIIIKGKELQEVDKELYSDEEIDEEIVEENTEVPEVPKPDEAEEDEVLDDVEIIDEEQLGEEIEEEEEDEEDISDVDDAELLTRLEAKYGRLPEPERPGRRNKDGGNSLGDWPGEPSDKYWRQQLDQAEDELGRGDWKAASHRLSSNKLSGSGRAKWLNARAIDTSAEQLRDNQLLSRAINAYLEVLKMHEQLNDAKLLQVTKRILDRIRFRGNYLSAEPVYRLLIRRYPDVVDYRNNLTISFLMANRADLAEEVLKETLTKWPKDRVALAHLGFVLKTQHNKHEEAVDAFQKALEGDTGPATEPRFYYHLGDSLLLLGRFAEAHEVHKRGAALGHFLSPAQRSLYNVDRLKSQPWWDVSKTPYARLARALEQSWKEILKEGEAAKTLYEMEKEGLREKGEWSQLDLFVRGMEVPDRCGRAPVTCSVVRSEVAASRCRRGQIKFSAMKPGTHVRPHVGPTNCRLRMHLALSNTKDTYIRVDKEIRQWQVGKVLMFDDSFEHEVWHNGTGTRLVLIVDVWHPALTPHERRTLAPI